MIAKEKRKEVVEHAAVGRVVSFSSTDVTSRWCLLKDRSCSSARFFQIRVSVCASLSHIVYS